MNRINMPTALVIITFLAAITVVDTWGPPGRDAALLTVGLAILGALGVTVVKQTETKEVAAAAKEQSNGNYSRLLDMLERQNQQLATMVPAPTIDGTATVTATAPAAQPVTPAPPQTVPPDPS